MAAETVRLYETAGPQGVSNIYATFLWNRLLPTLQERAVGIDRTVALAVYHQRHSDGLPYTDLHWEPIPAGTRVVEFDVTLAIRTRNFPPHFPSYLPQSFEEVPVVQRFLEIPEVTYGGLAGLAFRSIGVNWNYFARRCRAAFNTAICPTAEELVLATNLEALLKAQFPPA